MFAMNSQDILSSLKKEAGLCAELASLRSEQRRLIDAGEAEQLLAVLARKQRTISRIGELEERLRPVKAGWQEHCHDLPAAQRVAIGEAFREVRSLLEDLIARETEDVEALAARKQQVADDIQSFDCKRRIETAYRPAEDRPESRLVDRRDA